MTDAKLEDGRMDILGMLKSFDQERCNGYPGTAFAVMQQAIIEIERLRKLGHRRAIQSAAPLYGSEAAEIERLRAALKPFADAADRCEKREDKPLRFISIADLRAVRAALSPEKKT